LEAENCVVKIHGSFDEFLKGKGNSRQRTPGNSGKARLPYEDSLILLVGENRGILGKF